MGHTFTGLTFAQDPALCPCSQVAQAIANLVYHDNTTSWIPMPSNTCHRSWWDKGAESTQRPVQIHHPPLPGNSMSCPPMTGQWLRPHLWGMAHLSSGTAFPCPGTSWMSKLILKCRGLVLWLPSHTPHGPLHNVLISATSEPASFSPEVASFTRAMVVRSETTRWWKSPKHSGPFAWHDVEVHSLRWIPENPILI